ncbi:hypothetical protein BTS2_0850 [Bacillus sp. TS-2]|nr:hypothetical protein BTS2_0850 [Bacillus sp. TS-2]
MKWTIQQLKTAKHKPFIFNEKIDLSEVKKSESNIRSIQMATVSGRVEYVGNVLNIIYHLDTELILPCSRTLVDVPLKINISSKEQFREGENWYHIDEDGHEELVELSGVYLDFRAYLYERILLEIPIQIFADVVQEDDSKKAPSEGKDWQVVTESDRQNKMDPRLADLAKFFEKE